MYALFACMYRLHVFCVSKPCPYTLEFIESKYIVYVCVYVCVYAFVYVCIYVPNMVYAHTTRRECVARFFTRDRVRHTAAKYNIIPCETVHCSRR